ncbi:PAS domain S-box protein [Belnapia sp. F-4-1]|uniref:PAS domain-containing hybrid sensor histidine kinase/response regulator n=1 Tax=Belnapia sp. F-4-1 TaxID=1545443 RepID=UPI00068C88F5|nr:PAS domain S-box protein [Belnapia sp. F-4-1]
MHDQPGPDPEELRRERAALQREVERLRQELEEARRAPAGPAAELGALLDQRIAEDQARLIASRAAATLRGQADASPAAGWHEAELRTVIEGAIDCAIVVTGRDGHVLSWNPGAGALLGWGEAAALAGMPLDAALGPSDEAAASALAADAATVLGGGRVSREGWVRRRGNGRAWVAIEAMPLRAPGEAMPVGAVWMLHDRSAARLAEAALREEEAKYRILFEAMDEGVMIFERLPQRPDGLRDWRYVAMNPASKAMFRTGDLTGRSVRDHFPDEDEGWYDIFDRALDTGEVARFEREARSQGRILQMYVARVQDRARGRIMVVMQDVTTHRRAEAALRESEERFRSFAENSADVLWIVGEQGARLEYLSPAFERIFGESRDHLLADLGRWRDLVHPGDHAAAFAAMPRALAGETVIAQYRVVRPADGRVVHLRDTGFPIRDASGRVARVAGIVQDVSDMVAASGALETEKERFRRLAEGIPQLVWRSADGGDWSWASPQWIAFTGLTDAMSRGPGWLGAVHPDDRAAVRAAWSRAAAMGVVDAECRLRRAVDGTWRWFQMRGARGPAAGAGGAAEWLGACADIDDTIRAREALTRGAEELEARVAERTGALMAAEESLRQAQKMEAIGQLTGGIAHDFNNMLQGVTGALEMARRRMDDGRTADAARYMLAARDAAGRAASLTRRLLAFARRQRLDPKPLKPEALAAGMADMLRRMVGPAIALDLRLEDGAGAVLCDPNELESAILNLCINARDAMPEGGSLTIASRGARLGAAALRPDEAALPGDFIEIAVRDTGTGMGPEVMDRVLEPFFTTKPQGQGTGLGLSQVFGFVRQSGGVLRIASTVGRGTTVRLLLPRHGGGDAAVADEAAGAEQTELVAAGATVLMVDDETTVRMPAAERLRDLGYHVVEAPDGPAALRLLDEGLRPDLLVTDVGLPGRMDGRSVAEAAQERLPGLPVLFITGFARVALPDDAAVIPKPFDLEVLARAITAALPREG